LARLTSEHFVDRTLELLREHSGADVSLSTILKACDAQKGSLYHFFPGGKEALYAAAVGKMEHCASVHIRQSIDETSSAAEAVQKHLGRLAKLIEQPNSPIGMPFLALAATIGGANEGVRAACEKAVTTIESLFAKQLIKDGFAAKDAKRLASFFVLAVDGAILASRFQGNTKPLKLAAKTLEHLFTI
jgi:TetR/AcrR family transcriptional repressor of lmrAB and yxaGH operons